MAAQESQAREALQQAEDDANAGLITRNDLADIYELCLLCVGEKQRAELRLANAHRERRNCAIATWRGNRMEVTGDAVGT